MGLEILSNDHGKVHTRSRYTRCQAFTTSRCTPTLGSSSGSIGKRLINCGRYSTSVGCSSPFIYHSLRDAVTQRIRSLGVPLCWSHAFRSHDCRGKRFCVIGMHHSQQMLLIHLEVSHQPMAWQVIHRLIPWSPCISRMLYIQQH